MPKSPESEILAKCFADMGEKCGEKNGESFRRIFILRFPRKSSEVAKKSVSARPGPILEGTLGSRMGPGRAGMAPTSGPGWVRNTVKQSTWRIWTGPPRTWMGAGRAQDRTQARVWMAPPETVTDF